MTMEAVNAPELCNVYGATETYGNCAVTDAHDPRERRLTTQGLPLPGMEIRVVEPGTDRPLPPDTVGELRVRGRVTPGYYREPELTRAAFDADGFFVTGDLGRDRRGRPDPVPRPAQGDDQDGRHQRRPARGRGRAAGASGREAGVRRRRARSQQGRSGRGRRRAARGRHDDGRGARRILSRAALELQGARAHRLSERRRISPHGDGQGAEAAPSRGARSVHARRDLPRVGRGRDADDGRRAPADAPAWPGADRRQGGRGQLRRLADGGGPLPDASAAAVQPRHSRPPASWRRAARA